MIANLASEILGRGIYSPREAATYARVSTGLLSRWLFGSRQGREVLEPEYGNDDQKIVSFLDFVQILAVRAIRRNTTISLDKIRQAVLQVRSETGENFPFAVCHKIFVYEVTKEIVIELAEPRSLKQVSGKAVGQLHMQEIAEPFLKRIQFNEQGVAARYNAFEFETRKIIMDPNKRFGTPFVEGTAYSFDVLAHAFKTEGSARAAAEAYGVDESAIDLALAYEDYLWGQAPA